jgi:hypothetical protein
MGTNFGGAPKGNKNATKGRRWREALDQELAQLEINGKPVGTVMAGLRAIAKRVVTDAYNGNYQAITEIGIRQDGRPAQAVHVTGEDGGPIEHHQISDLELARRILFDLHEAEREREQAPQH